MYESRHQSLPNLGLGLVRLLNVGQALSARLKSNPEAVARHNQQFPFPLRISRSFVALK